MAGNRRVLTAAAITAAATLGIGGLAVFHAPVVMVTSAHKGVAIEATYGTGTVEALDRAEVKPRVSGNVIQVLVKEGDVVQADQVLARLSAPATESEFYRARGELASIEARATAASAELAAARAESDRVRKLVTTQTLSNSDAERAETRLAVLRAELSGLDAQRRALSSDLGSRSTHSGQEVHSRDLEIRSPMSGLVLRRIIAVGDYVSPLSMAFTVGKLESLVVETLVDESDISKITRDTPVVFSFRSEPGKSFDGKVLEMPLDSDRAKHGFLVKISIVNPPKDLRAGIGAELNFETQRHEGALLVPASAVGPDGAVLLVQGGVVHRGSLKMGIRGRREVEVLSGLTENDVVIARFDELLSPGSRVRGEREATAK